MSLVKNKKLQIAMVVFSVATLTLIVALVNDSKKPARPNKISTENGSESFTFFELGENTKFSKDVRDNLKDKLGSEAIERWSTIDLAINYTGFLKTHFPELHELNKKLNSPFGERVEHDTIQLTYRHARKKKAPFEYVKLIFSNYNKKPLLFYIKSKKEGSDIIEAIAKKFGQAKTISWDKEEGRSLYWKKNRSILIISISNDRFGNPEYYTTIYYVPNLEKLVIREQNKIKQREEEIKKTGKTAF
jgi:hypothetical protein